MALKKEAVENFFKISQQHANSQKKSPVADTTIDKIENQYSEKTQHKPNTNPTQTQHISDTNFTHIPNTRFAQVEKLNTEPNTQTYTNSTQIQHKFNIHIDKEPSFENLVGNFKKIILYIYNQCKFNGTCEIILSITVMASTIQIPAGSVNTTLVRLEKKGYIQKIKSQAGRGGWKKIKLAEHIYREMVFAETSHKLNTNLTQIQHKPNTELNTKYNTTFSSSSGIDILNTTTTEEAGNPKTDVLNDEWLKIDIEPLSSIGFTQTHLMQIASQNKLQVLSVQNSIYAFAFDLQKNDKAKSIKGDPINFFMGILRNGKPYAPPSNYESPQDEAIRIYLEKMREIEQKRVEAEKEAINLAFNDWFSKLTGEQKIGFLPEMLRRTAIQRNENGEKLDKSKILESSARKHFEIEIWPKEKEKIIGEVK